MVPSADRVENLFVSLLAANLEKGKAVADLSRVTEIYNCLAGSNSTPNAVSKHIRLFTIRASQVLDTLQSNTSNPVAPNMPKNGRKAAPKAAKPSKKAQNRVKSGRVGKSKTRNSMLDQVVEKDNDEAFDEVSDEVSDENDDDDDGMSDEELRSVASPVVEESVIKKEVEDKTFTELCDEVASGARSSFADRYEEVLAEL